MYNYKKNIPVQGSVSFLNFQKNKLMMKVKLELTILTEFEDHDFNKSDRNDASSTNGNELNMSKNEGIFFLLEPLPQKNNTELSYFTLLNLLTYMQDF